MNDCASPTINLLNTAAGSTIATIHQAPSPMPLFGNDDAASPTFYLCGHCCQPFTDHVMTTIVWQLWYRTKMTLEDASSEMAVKADAAITAETDATTNKMTV